MRQSIFDRVDKYRFHDVFAEVKAGSGQIYIYGAGGLARCVYHRLREREIFVDGFLVDDEFSKQTSFCELPVMTFSDVGNKGKPYSIVLGMADYLKGEEKQRIYPQIKKVYAFVDVPYKNIIATRDVVKKKRKLFENAEELLSDEKSRSCLEAWIASGLSGEARYCYPLAETKQTYFSNDIYQVSKEETLLDIGAFTGDTIEQFLNITNRNFSYIYGIEGDKQNFDNLKNNILNWKINDRIEVFNVVCDEKERQVSFATRFDEKDGYYFLPDDMGMIKSVTLDRLLENRKRITLIKANFPKIISVLQGAEQILKADKPKLALMVGWGATLAAEAVLFLNKVLPEYKIYLRFASPMPSRIMLFASI